MARESVSRIIIRGLVHRGIRQIVSRNRIIHIRTILNLFNKIKIIKKINMKGKAIVFS